MAVSRQELLREAWLGGRTGYLSAMEEARAWALREAWKDEHGESTYGMLTHIASKVYKIAPKGAKRQKQHPSPSALSQLFEKIDNDSQWFPGKSEQVQFGPAPAINSTNQTIIARSAMAMKENGQEPTYPLIVAANPRASQNPGTNRPVHKKAIYKVLRKRCYDDPKDKEDTWDHAARWSKKALTDGQMKARHRWALGMLRNPKTPKWYYNNLIWTDICNSILPRSELKSQQQALARKGKKGWGSKKKALAQKNLQGDQRATQQNSYDAIRVYWAPILTRGKLHIEILGEGFPGETSAGAATLVGRVRHAVNTRFRGTSKPSILFIDRGQGFYCKGASMDGQITNKLKAALQEHSLKAFYGDDASAQPGNLQEVMLHETAVSWIRYRETQTRPRQPWLEQVSEFSTRMRGICQDINDNLDVEGLCWALPKRLQKLKDSKGDRISE